MNVHFTFNISIDDRIIGAMKKTFTKRNIIALVAISVIAISAIVYAAVAKPHTFTPGAVISSSQVNENFDAAFREIARMVPVGAIIAWHKSMTNTPALPGEWAECNGQVLIDDESVYNEQTIPNLNGESGGADSPDISRKEAMFLRGGLTSGSGQDHRFQEHSHNHRHGITAYDGGTGWDYAEEFTGAYGTSSSYYTNYDNTMPTSGNYGSETRPVNMSVVWIMRVK